MGTGSCPCTQLPALVCEPGKSLVYLTRGAGGGGSSAEGSQPHQCQIILVVHFPQAHLMWEHGQLTWYTAPRRRGLMGIAPWILPALRVAGRRWGILPLTIGAQVGGGRRFPEDTAAAPQRGGRASHLSGAGEELTQRW